MLPDEAKTVRNPTGPDGVNRSGEALRWRTPGAELERQTQLITRHPEIAKLYDTVTDAIMILNQKWQIVYLSQNGKAIFGNDSTERMKGQRFGNAVNCIHTADEKYICGTTESCSQCGVNKSLLASISEQGGNEECTITLKPPCNPLHILMKTTFIEIEDEPFTVAAISDISEKVRRKELERIFFHDILNTASSVQGLTQLLDPGSEEEFQRIQTYILHGTEFLIDEIQAQKSLIEAERGELKVSSTCLNSAQLLNQLINSFLPEAQQQRIEVRAEEGLQDLELVSDRTLLARLLRNFIKNAIEASEPGQVVTIGCLDMDDVVQFTVHNDAYMPKETQNKVFDRSFSTKGAGRGIGTYSAKLIGEQYLDGLIGFISTTKNGTTFWLNLPKFPEHGTGDPHIQLKAN